MMTEVTVDSPCVTSTDLREEGVGEIYECFEVLQRAGQERSDGSNCETKEPKNVFGISKLFVVLPENTRFVKRSRTSIPLLIFQVTYQCCNVPNGRSTSELLVPDVL